jgi:hypothetical protein
MARPYLPALLRLLHGTTAAGVALAWLSGLVVYSNHDGRWGRLPLTIPGDWIDLHGSIAVVLGPLALLFTLYAMSLGRWRLRQPGNAFDLAALVLAVGSGKLMQEDWLRQGQLDPLVYRVHLLAWLAVAASVAAHLWGVLRRGGTPLLQAMFSLRVRADDQPRHWPDQIRRYLKRSS